MIYGPRVRFPIAAFLALGACLTTASGADELRERPFGVQHSYTGSPNSGGAAGAVVHYNAGNAAYREGRFADAVAAYEEAVRAGAGNSAVYYNLGNAYFRLGQIGRAILSYERSLRLNPRNDDARRNLDFVSLLITDRIEEENVEIRVQAMVRRALGLLDPNWLAIAATLGFTVLCLIGAWWILGGRRNGLAIAVFVLSAFLFVGGTGVAGVQRWVSGEANEAILLASQAEARFEPSTSAKVSFVLHEGTKVWVERGEDGWALVHVANGLRGWIPDDAFMAI